MSSKNLIFPMKQMIDKKKSLFDNKNILIYY